MVGTWRAFANLHKKLVHSYVMDALETAGAEEEGNSRSTQDKSWQALGLGEKRGGKDASIRGPRTGHPHGIRSTSGSWFWSLKAMYSN